MVAITVILAAVIAAFVLDMGDMGDQPPSTQFNYDENVSGKYVEISISGGESIDTDNLLIATSEMDDERVSGLAGTGYFMAGGTEEIPVGDWDGSEVGAGDSITLYADLDAAADHHGGDSTDYSENIHYNPGDTIQLIWVGDGEGQILDEYETTS
ncbi:Protein of unknown function [Halobiforma haloterrestris]|uniref:Archaeal Type IV pilin N-terminal domain-containing protein n=2 Tax=Natronobacterium haloterrestre TaxID=148448 RepID=A0A1I1KX38_NATHA|nr:Protein of unknown function [Halobiforma haloterrestris]